MIITLSEDDSAIIYDIFKEYGKVQALQMLESAFLFQERYKSDVSEKAPTSEYRSSEITVLLKDILSELRELNTKDFVVQENSNKSVDYEQLKSTEGIDFSKSLSIFDDV